MEYAFFDGLIDSVFVIDSDRNIVYCNEPAAALCESSVKRLVRRKPLFEIIEFMNKNLFTMPGGTVGKLEPAPYQEMVFKLKGTEKSGKVQLAIHPFKEPSGDDRWVVVARDVTLEEVLHAKYHKQLEEKEVYIRQLQEAQKKLEQYSKNLEQMVEERTREVKRANVMLNAIMNSLGQGFFAFDEKGDCAEFFTRACLDILETAPANKKAWDVLKVKESERSTFEMWMKAVFSETLPFESLRELGPAKFEHSKDRHIKLEYFPIRDNAGSQDENAGPIRNVVVVATDRTTEFLANEALEHEKKFARMVVKLVTFRRQFSQFLLGVRQTLDEISKRVANAQSLSNEDRAWLYRALHTLEGEAATYSIQELWSGARKCQEVLSASVGEFANALNELGEQYSQFLNANKILFTSLGVFEEGGSRIELSRKEIENLLSRLKKIGIAPEPFSLIVERLEKEPISQLLNHFDDTLQMVAKKLQKDIAPLKITGGEYRLFAEPYKNLFSSLVHVFRNCVDHGIEPSEQRVAAGKPEQGHIEIHIESFSHDSQPWFRLRISDDGKGIPKDVIPHVFESGFTTRTQVGEYSGRGVGMNVIAVEAEALGGRAWVESEVGKGTTIIIEVPDLQKVAHHSSAA